MLSLVRLGARRLTLTQGSMNWRQPWASMTTTTHFKGHAECEKRLRFELTAQSTSNGAARARWPGAERQGRARMEGGAPARQGRLEDVQKVLPSGVVLGSSLKAARAPRQPRPTV